MVLLTLVVGRLQPFAGDDHPDEWDPRLASLAQSVEQLTDRTFDHPVDVRFLSDADFEEDIRTDEADLDDDARQQYAETEELGRALGLFSGATDVFEETNDLRGSGVLAYYSYSDEEIVVRLPDGTAPDDILTADDLPLDVQVTLVHELVHTMQDQRYDLHEIRADAAGDDSTSAAVLSLIEGHASWIEQRYVREQLTDAERQRYQDANQAAVDDFEEATADTSLVLSALQALPYVTGPALAGGLEAEGGAERIDAAFADPPAAEDQVLLPLTFVDGDEPEDVDTPEVPEGSTQVDDGRWGAPTLYMMLATALPPQEALALTNRWGNDAYITTREGDDGPLCVRATVVGDDDGATDALATGLTAWVAARPAEASASVRRVDDRIELITCDPGPDVVQDVPARSQVEQLFGRSGDLAALLAQGTDLPTAQCIADGVYTRFSVEDLSGDSPSSEAQAEIQRLLSTCR